ncbi:hypothetical protein C8R44DRAFT_748675 [Mycena epipterygia]|nr:hypothetical protein C8R44DRAFT_748675 [Mycena epipterygia]
MDYAQQPAAEFVRMIESRVDDAHRAGSACLEALRVTNIVLERNTHLLLLSLRRSGLRVAVVDQYDSDREMEPEEDEGTAPELVDGRASENSGPGGTPSSLLSGFWAHSVGEQFTARFVREYGTITTFGGPNSQMRQERSEEWTACTGRGEDILGNVNRLSATNRLILSIGRSEEVEIVDLRLNLGWMSAICPGKRAKPQNQGGFRSIKR